MLDFHDRMGRKLTADEVRSKLINRISSIFLDFELFLLRLCGNIPSHCFRLFVYRLAGLKIDSSSRIHMWCNFYNPKGITIGKDTIIGDHAFLDGRGKLTIGSHVAIASYVAIYNSQHDIDSDDFHAVEREVVIEDYVFIGPRCIILPGVRIGRGAVIAAGAVVSENIKQFTVVGGVPAKFIRERKNKNPHYQLGRVRLFQ